MFYIGIVGCGWIIEKAYLPVLSNMEDIIISAVFDINLDRAYRIQTKYKIKNIFDNIGDFLNSEIDAVIVATPNNTHSYYSRVCLMAGKHVLCEKPVAFSKEEIEYIISISREKQKVFLPAFVNRFRKDIQTYIEWVSRMKEVKKVEVRWIRKSGIPKPGTWITNKKMSGGGALIDIGTHILDIGVMFIPNKTIQSVCMEQGKSRNIEYEKAQWNDTNIEEHLPMNVETWAKGKIKFENDVELEFNTSWASDIEEDITEIVVRSNTGIVCIKTLFGFSDNFIRDRIEISYKNEDEEEKKNFLPMKNTFAIDAFEKLIRYFLDSIRGGILDKLEPIDSIYVVDIIEKLYQLFTKEDK